MRKKQKDWAKDMAYQRMHLLFELADHEFKTHPNSKPTFERCARQPKFDS